MGKKNKKHHFRDSRSEPRADIRELDLDESFDQNAPQYSEQNITDVKSNIPETMSDESQKNEMTQKNDRSMMAKYWNIAIGAVILVTILVVFLLAGGSENKKDSDREREESPVSESISAIQGSVISSQKMTPVEDGEFIYSFENIDWVLTPQDLSVEGAENTASTSTAVAFYFEGFTRRNSVVAQFNRPYKLGVHEGSCSVAENITYDTTLETGIPLSFVTCRTGEVGSDIALFQQDQNIVAKKREITLELDSNTDKQMVVAGEFGELYTIPLNTVIR